MTRARPGIAALLLATLAASPARAAIPTPWVPANAGVLWYQPGDPNYPITIPRQPPGSASGAWWLTRRLAASPHVPGLMHLGSFLHGMYVSEGGGAWAMLTPACILPPDRPASIPASDPVYKASRDLLRGISGLDACAVEGIAYDPFNPARIYVSAYDVLSLKGSEPVLGVGGVYVSDNLGVSWDKLAGGIRGNGLAVHRSSPTSAATIVVGYIQANNAGVGATPGNGSLMVSRDDGSSWQNVVLPASGCTDTVEQSQRITPTIAFNPVDGSKIYAGTNAGLYSSSDGGATWSLTKQVCGGVWGLALTPDGSSIYIGDKDGVISKAPTSSMQFAPIVDVDGASATKIQSLALDPRDNKTLYAAAWFGSTLGVFRVRGDAAPADRLGDSLLSDYIPLDQAWPQGVPKPFPLTFGPNAATPSLFVSTLPLSKTLKPVPGSPGPLYVSTIFRGVFARGD